MDQYIQWWHRLKGHRQRYVTTNGLWTGTSRGFVFYRCSCGKAWRA